MLSGSAHGAPAKYTILTFRRGQLLTIRSNDDFGKDPLYYYIYKDNLIINVAFFLLTKPSLDKNTELKRRDNMGKRDLHDASTSTRRMA